MWLVEALEFSAVTLDFTSSGQGTRRATVVTAQGIRLVNALELVDVQRDATQVEVCEACGFSGCSPGGWVSLRSVAGHVAWTPAWTRMQRGAWEASEFAPPTFVREHGAPFLASGTWDHLRARHDGFPDLGAIPPLDSSDAVRLLQIAAPGRILGQDGQAPTLREEALLAVTEGELAPEVAAIERFLMSCVERPRTLAAVPLDGAVRPIEIWLDLPGTPSWTALVRIGDTFGLRVHERMVLVVD